MEARSRASRSRRHGKDTNGCDLFKISKIPFAFALIIADAVLVALIYIGWDAYIMHGSLNGDTWPLVYPAGFLYVYSAIQNLTGGQVFPAQILFGLVYIANLAIVLFIHLNTHVRSRLYKDECTLVCSSAFVASPTKGPRK
uniref:dolichyl-P-Man:Man5GlcNAc2-PP-dolichol alpha-1,3-mannosyltransferase n=1 Tax=Brassica oleracea TaxID=3712 RepID=A0A3P6ATZ4_BRAOL|nr:unnamed protein product [Brassica oleracea]